jgi:hypothetical protein
LGRAPWEERANSFRDSLYSQWTAEKGEKGELCFPVSLTHTPASPYLPLLEAHLPSLARDACLSVCLILTFTSSTLVSPFGGAFSSQLATFLKVYYSAHPRGDSNTDKTSPRRKANQTAHLQCNRREWRHWIVAPKEQTFVCSLVLSTIFLGPVLWGWHCPIPWPTGSSFFGKELVPDNLDP